MSRLIYLEIKKTNKESSVNNITTLRVNDFVTTVLSSTKSAKMEHTGKKLKIILHATNS